MSKIYDKLTSTNLGNRVANDQRYRTVLFATAALIINMLYAFGNLALGLYERSYWFITVSAYYTVLSVMRFSAVLFERKSVDPEYRKSELFVQKFSGIMLVALSIVLAGSVYMSVTFDVIGSLHEIIMIAIATFTFIKITVAIINVVKNRQDGSPLLTTLRNISLSDAAVSVLSMQRSMLVTFDGMAEFDIKMLNGIVGTVVYLFVCALGISMIVKSKQKKETEKWQNQK